MIEKYKTKVESTYDNNLSLIKILESDSDIDTDMGVELYEYIMTKFADNLSHVNFSNKDYEYEPGSIATLNIHNFKWQNIYTLIYLNAMFYHDSESSGHPSRKHRG